jgi:phosphatidylethanolamine/phosphatidyl-N-methylethanolamine N-methyltransferase
MENFSAEPSRKQWYAGGYKNCYYTGVLGTVYGLVHNLMEHRYRKLENISTVLEVGAGNGEHFKYVKHNFERYILTDIEPIDSSILEIDSRIILNQIDCTKVTFLNDNSVDRLIATCLLVHLNDPQAALVEWRRLVRPGGTLTIYIAPEPGLLLRIVRKLFIWPKSKKSGLVDPELFAYAEHKNHYPAMNAMVKNVFSKDKVTRKRYPLPIPLWNLMLFEIVHIHIET